MWGKVINYLHTHQTLAHLTAFRSKLVAAPPQQPSQPESSTEDAELCTLHSVPNCLSCQDTFGQAQDDVTDEGWLSHQLVFEKDHKGKDLMRRRDDPNDFIVIDPLARKQQAIEEEKEKRTQNKNRKRDSNRDAEDRRHDYDRDHRSSRR